MSKRCDLVLTKERTLPVYYPKFVNSYSPSLCLPSGSDNDSEDEPLARRVRPVSGFKNSTFDHPEHTPSTRDSGSLMSEESECESAFEEDSESDSDEEDDVIYLGRENLLASARSQSLLSRWLVPLAEAVEVVDV